MPSSEWHHGEDGDDYKHYYHSMFLQACSTLYALTCEQMLMTKTTPLSSFPAWACSINDRDKDDAGVAFNTHQMHNIEKRTESGLLYILVYILMIGNEF